MNRTAWLAMALLVAILPTGCVTRRYIITSDPPGAIVYRDGQPIGPTPVEEPFIYYGKYRFRLVKDGYEPLDVEPEMVIPWYQYVGVDFVAENFIPFTFRDKQVLHFQLKPMVPVRHDDLRLRAQQLRDRGKLVQPPPGLVLPPRRTNPPPAPPGPPPTVLPPPVGVSPPVPGPSAVPVPPPPPTAPFPEAGSTRPIGPSTSP